MKHAIGCASGTDALVLAIKALEFGPDDEVITTPFTFFATVSSIWRNGAKPRFVDITLKPSTLIRIRSRLPSIPRPRLSCRYTFSAMLRYDRIAEIANKHGLKVIEDNAQGIGSTWDGK